MRLKLISLAFMLMALGSLILFSCEEEPDETKPVIKLNGSTSIRWVLNRSFEEFEDPGYTATDNVDGDLTEMVTVNTSNVNVDQTGVYEIEYYVLDNSENGDTVYRSIEVYNQAEVLNGYWDGDIDGATPKEYVDVIASSETTNLEITFEKFGGYAENPITGTVVYEGVENAPVVQIAEQSNTIDGEEHTFVVSNGYGLLRSNNKITLQYSDNGEMYLLTLIKQ